MIIPLAAYGLDNLILLHILIPKHRNIHLLGYIILEACERGIRLVFVEILIAIIIS